MLCCALPQLDLQIYTYNLRDRIEWDLGSNDLTPEQFTKHYCAELGLTGEAHAIIAHAIHEELLKHKKDALEMGWLGPGAGVDWGDGTGNLRRDGPRKLKTIWRDWNERDDFGPSLAMMSMDEIEKKEMERIRAARYVTTDGPV
jgi:chromatin structure-remodeling complex subunit SFH1